MHGLRHWLKGRVLPPLLPLLLEPSRGQRASRPPTMSRPSAHPHLPSAPSLCRRALNWPSTTCSISAITRSRPISAATSTSAAPPPQPLPPTITACGRHPTPLGMPLLRRPSSPALNSTSKDLAALLGAPISVALAGPLLALLALPAPRARLGMDMCTPILRDTRLVLRWAKCFTPVPRQPADPAVRNRVRLHMTPNLVGRSSGPMPSSTG